MKRILSIIGFEASLDVKNKFTYVIVTVSVGLVLLFFVFYIFYVKSSLVNTVTSLCLLDFLIVFVFLKFRKFEMAKFLLIFGFLFQEFFLVFLWFPVEADFNYFFFIVAPISFFIYEFELPKERIAIIVANVLAIFLLILSEVLPLEAPLIPLTDNMIKLFSILSVLSTIGSILVVFYFYANNLSVTHKELKYLANTDSLTHTFNRRTLNKEGEALLKLCRKYHRNFTFVIFDIDHFKRVNDQHGHPVGDTVLVQITDFVSQKIRQNDIFFRYGGEEFALILKDTSTDANVKAAHHIRETVANHDFVISDSLTIHLTISVGVVSYSEKYEVFDEIVKLADQALYDAKEGGRNQVVVRS